MRGDQARRCLAASDGRDLQGEEGKGFTPIRSAGISGRDLLRYPEFGSLGQTRDGHEEFTQGKASRKNTGFWRDGRFCHREEWEGMLKSGIGKPSVSGERNFIDVRGPRKPAGQIGWPAGSLTYRPFALERFC